MGTYSESDIRKAQFQNIMSDQIDELDEEAAALQAAFDRGELSAEDFEFKMDCVDLMILAAGNLSYEDLFDPLDLPQILSSTATRKAEVARLQKIVEKNFRGIPGANAAARVAEEINSELNWKQVFAELDAKICDMLEEYLEDLAKGQVMLQYDPEDARNFLRHHGRTPRF